MRRGDRQRIPRDESPRTRLFARGTKFESGFLQQRVRNELLVGSSPFSSRGESALFAAMQRNSVHLTDYFRLPLDSVVELGREVSI
jgi:K+ transporter